MLGCCRQKQVAVSDLLIIQLLKGGNSKEIIVIKRKKSTFENKSTDKSVFPQKINKRMKEIIGGSKKI